LVLGFKLQAEGKSLSFEYASMYIIMYSAAMAVLTERLRWNGRFVAQ